MRGKMSENSSANETLKKGIENTYRIDGVNLPIILYEGPIRVTNGHFDKTGQGTIHYSWHPFQAINLEFETIERAQSSVSLNMPTAFRTAPLEASISKFSQSQTDEIYSGIFAGTMNIFLEENGAQLKGRLSHVKDSISKRHLESRYFGNIYSNTLINRTNTSKDAPVVGRVEFILINLQEILFLNDGAKYFEEGVPLIFNEWQILINKRDEMLDVRKELREFGGYGVTHTCSIQKTDGSMFSFNEAEPLIHRIGLYLSYLRGEWSSALLPICFDSNNEAVLHDWSEQGKISPWKQLLTDDKPLNIGTKEVGFLPFLKLCQDPLWSIPIQSALRWYIECSSKSSGVEGSIIIQMAAFELLSWMIFVQSPATKKYSNSDFSSMNLKSKIHKLLDWVDSNKDINVPLYISLYLFAKQEGNKEKNPTLYTDDAPALLKKIRDALTHPEQSKQAFLSRISVTAMNEAYKLGQVYLEAILEKIFGGNPYIPNPKPTAQ